MEAESVWNQVFVHFLSKISNARGNVNKYTNKVDSERRRVLCSSSVEAATCTLATQQQRQCSLWLETLILQRYIVTSSWLAPMLAQEPVILEIYSWLCWMWIEIACDWLWSPFRSISLHDISLQHPGSSIRIWPSRRILALPRVWWIFLTYMWWLLWWWW